MKNLLEKYPEILDVATVAEILGVTPATVRRLLKENTIPSVKIGRFTRIIKNNLITYLEEGRVWYMQEKTHVQLEILFLNDLFMNKVIDKEIYDKAVAKINNKRLTIN